MRAAPVGARPPAIVGRPPMMQRAAVSSKGQRGGGGGGGGAGAAARAGPLPEAQQHQWLAPRLVAAAAVAAASASRPVLLAPSTAAAATRRKRSLSRAAAAASSPSSSPDHDNDDDSDDSGALDKAAQLRLALGALALFLAALAAGLYYTASAGLTAPASAAALKEAVAQSPLGHSGLLPAFSLIFLSEVGDKTFFIAALLAAKLGRAVAFAGSMAALSLMTAISVLIGAMCSRVPEALRSSLPLGEVAGTLLLVAFGVRALREALRAPEAGPSGVEEELADAREVVEGSAAEGGAAGGAANKAPASTAAAASASPSSSPPAKALGMRLFEVATLIFLAEWGDRSMLATVALGAAQSPWAVAVGATAGHAAATAIAVVGGALAGSRVSERAINATSGVLFLLFAAATLFTAF